MPIYNRLFTIALVAFLMGASFVGGYRAKSAVSAAVAKTPGLASPGVVLASLTDPQGPGLFSERVDSASLTVFWEALYHLRQKYVEPITDDRKLVYGAIKGMLRTLDPYTRFMDPSDYREFMEESKGQFQGIGALLGMEKDTERVVVVTVFERNPAAAAGLKAGDYIVAIDGVETEGMSLEAAVARIKGVAGTPVTLTVERRKVGEGNSRFKLLAMPDDEAGKGGLRCPHCQQALRLKEEPAQWETLEIPIKRGHVAIPILEHRMLEDQVGYVWLKMFNDRASQEIGQAIHDLLKQGMRALILDLRHNPGGLLDMAVDVSSQFVPEGPVVFIKERDKEPTPLQAVASSYLNLRKPLVVLVDEQSASASEIVAGAVQDHHMGTVVGKTTYGKGLVQTVIELSDKSALVVTTAKYLTPNQRDINQSGIQPDVEVELPEDFDVGKFGSKEDPQISKALEIVHRQLEDKPAIASGSGGRKPL